MNPFLTEKATKKRFWEIPVLIICLFFLGIFAGILFDQFKEKDMSLVIMSVLFILFNIYVIYRILWHRLLQLKALRFAGALEDCPEASLSLDDFGDLVAEKNVEKTFLSLLDGHYLQDVKYNKATRLIQLTAADNKVENEDYVAVECPSCGAKTRVLRGRISRCPYCNQELQGR